MPTHCSARPHEFARVEKRIVVAAFDGGAVTSDAGGLLLGSTDWAIRLLDRFAGCFTDHRRPDLVEHEVRTLVGQRVFGIALGYEDLSDYDQLRHDPMMRALAGKLEAHRETCAPLAGKSTLNRPELSRPEPTCYHKISHDPEPIEDLFVTLFLEAHKKAPRQVILDLDATEDPIHGHQEGRFFHGYCDSYCGGTCWPPGSGARTSMRQQERARKSSGSSAKSGIVGHARAYCCAPTAAFAAMN